ncbi:MAG: inorganic phosphate transporter [Thermococci archaeon]|nr:inorganic phosphate transporter [Thermococci archaeon]
MFLALSAMFMAWAVGANDSAKAVGTAVGSGVIGFKKAVMIITVFTTLGALIGHSAVSGTVKGLAHGMTPWEVSLVLISAAMAVTMFSLWGTPISTTQSLIGALVGASLSVGTHVNWLAFGMIGVAWALSPIIAGVTAVIVYKVYAMWLRHVKSMERLEVTHKWLIFTASTYTAFNLGMNELANVIGLSAALGYGGYFRVVLALILALGTLTFSYNVIMTLGRDISPLGPLPAFSAQFGSAIAVSVANSFGLPVSTGQAVVGGITGVSAYKGERIDWRVVLGIVRGWLVAPLSAGTLAFLLIKLLA